MRRRLMWAVVFGTAIVCLAAYVGNALASPASGFTGTTLAVGRFGDIEVSNHLLTDGALRKDGFWLSVQKTKGPSDLYRDRV